MSAKAQSRTIALSALFVTAFLDVKWFQFPNFLMFLLSTTLNMYRKNRCSSWTDIRPEHRVLWRAKSVYRFSFFLLRQPVMSASFSCTTLQFYLTHVYNVIGMQISWNCCLLRSTLAFFAPAGILSSFLLATLNAAKNTYYVVKLLRLNCRTWHALRRRYD